MEQLNIKQLHDQKHFFKEWNTNTYYSVDDSHKRHAKWKMPDTKVVHRMIPFIWNIQNK